jgi:hypothetical protein
MVHGTSDAVAGMLHGFHALAIPAADRLGVPEAASGCVFFLFFLHLIN